MEDQMLNEIATILARSRSTVVEDGLGAVLLFALLYAGLHMSGAA
jgi:hypothetical protein